MKARRKKLYPIFWDHEKKLYIGPNYAEHPAVNDQSEIRKAIRRYYAQKIRAGVKYSLGEFVYWWTYVADKNIGEKNPSHVHVGRIDHSKPYSFDNVIVQSIVENSIERNERVGLPDNGRRVIAFYDNGKKKSFVDKKSAAAFFKVSEKTIYNHAMGRTKNSFSYGPGSGRKLRFEWA